ncbi:MAG: acyl-CoA dehydrogenase family protein [Deltaproteobacteria bacterium]|nr:acyl-CoA dehydrogenase family protein [Deltaproteobacteria bacterium]
MISFELSKEQKRLQDKFHKIAEFEIRPLAIDMDKKLPGPIDPSFLRILANNNLNALIIPREYGGKAVDSVTLALIEEELAWGSVDFISIINATFHALMTILIGGSKEQKSKFLPMMLSPAGAVASFCSTEEKSGSDSSSYSTLARFKNDRYILDGQKNPIVNAGDSLFNIVWANLENQKDRSGINAFIVPATTKGISIGPFHDKSGFRGMPAAMVSFSGASIPKNNLIGVPGSGYLLLMQVVDWGRAIAGATSVGLARAAVEEALGYAKTRLIKKRPIISNQGVSFILSELTTQLAAARLLVWKACRLIDLGLDYTAAASMAKLFASELAVRAATEGMLILGHKSYFRPSLMEKLLRDSQLSRIIEGTSQIQKIIIANQL